MRKQQKPLDLKTSLTNSLKTEDRNHRSRTSALADLPITPSRNDILPGLELVQIAIEKLTIPTRNVRILNQSHIRELANAMSSLGFCVPALVGKENLVVDGLTRIEAAKLLGLREIPCVRIDHLSDIEQRTLRLAVNRLGEKGQWSLPELKIELEDLSLAEASIEITGFEPPELDQLMFSPEGELEKTALEPSPNGGPIARVGDMYQLGDHFLICGDATDPAVLGRLLANVQRPARMIFTDPPYNVRIAGNVTKTPHREFTMASGEMSDEQFLAFNRNWLAATTPYLINGGVVAAFIDWRGYPIVHAAAVAESLTALNLVVWTKTNAGLGSLFRSQHEFLPIYRKGNAPHLNNINLGKKGRWRSNVWAYAGASSVGSDARKGLIHHPTVKPVQMLAEGLLDFTDAGDVILDPFLGSGSTLMAAQSTKRICLGVEIDPLYVDVIIRRFEATTRRTAIRLNHDNANEKLEQSQKQDGVPGQ
ncbi:DNA modification methylase [Methylocella sp. CPCC 101449]|uniref:DNA modification methylase n=1 Tax=Methylocella sp. CPCC 101449 TaxID=2987531 RepID=UPI002890F0DD|nr:DNA modification methylase [Methylocella sp. CPCC 101449]MDT2021226.1 DNA modification methylase [Methylocella sp. CPCC 101449]